jgi:hypothetical protein
MVPDSRISEVITSAHDSIVAGHWGSRKTLQILQRLYIFDDMKAHVTNHVSTCDLCQRIKSD